MAKRKNIPAFTLVVTAAIVFYLFFAKRVKTLQRLVGILRRLIRRSERKLHQSEMLYHTLFDNMMHGMVYGEVIFKNQKAVDYIYIKVNPAFEKLTGIRNAAGKKVSELIPQLIHSNPEYFEAIGRVAKGGKPEKLEMYVVSLDRWFALSMYGPQPGFFMSIVDNVTESKKFEKQLILSEERLKEAQAIGHIGNWEIDLVNQEQTWSDEIYSIYGTSKEQSVPSVASFLSFMHIDDLSFATKSMALALISDENTSFNYRFVRTDGAIRYGYTEWKFELGKNGRPVRLFGITQDVTDKKSEEKHLRLLESVITNANEAVLITDASPLDLPGPVIVFVNDAFTTMTGYSREEVLGKTPRMLQGPKTDSGILAKLSTSLRQGEPAEMEIINYKKDGTEYWCNATIAPVVDKAGVTTHFIAIEKDVTDKLKDILEIKNQNIKLRDIAWMQSHDVRGPLARILGLISLLNMQPREKTDTSTRELMEHLNASARELDDVIGKIVSETYSVIQ